jgi:hypothetical protein
MEEISQTFSFQSLEGFKLNFDQVRQLEVDGNSSVGLAWQIRCHITLLEKRFCLNYGCRETNQAW